MLKMLNSKLKFFLNFKYIFAPVERWAGPGRQAGWGQNNLHWSLLQPTMHRQTSRPDKTLILDHRFHFTISQSAQHPSLLNYGKHGQKHGQFHLQLKAFYELSRLSKVFSILYHRSRSLMVIIIIYVVARRYWEASTSNELRSIHPITTNQLIS